MKSKEGLVKTGNKMLITKIRKKHLKELLGRRRK